MQKYLTDFRFSVLLKADAVSPAQNIIDFKTNCRDFNEIIFKRKL